MTIGGFTRRRSTRSQMNQFVLTESVPLPRNECRGRPMIREGGCSASHGPRFSVGSRNYCRSSRQTERRATSSACTSSSNAMLNGGFVMT